MKRSKIIRPTRREWTFLWAGFHGVTVYGKDKTEAEINALSRRPSYIPEGTELRFYTFRDMPIHN